MPRFFPQFVHLPRWFSRLDGGLSRISLTRSGFIKGFSIPFFLSAIGSPFFLAVIGIPFFLAAIGSPFFLSVIGIRTGRADHPYRLPEWYGFGLPSCFRYQNGRLCRWLHP